MDRRVTTEPTVLGPSFVGGSGNIYADLGFEEPEMELMRDRLARRLATEIRARHLAVSAAAELLGTDQVMIGAILDGDLSDVSVAALIIFLTRVGQDVTVTVIPASTGGSTGRLEVDPELMVAS